MNVEIDQQQKFTELFSKMVADASQRFKDKWDKEVIFTNPTHEKIVPSLNAGALHLLSSDLREKYEILRKKYFEKSL